MGLSIYNIKKWTKMFQGKSILHVEQNVGKSFRPKELYGYFNDMTKKVTMQKNLLKSDELPKITTEKGEKVLFPVAVFQYGLGCWDLYLQTNEDVYRKKFFDCAQWAIDVQNSNGSWNNFFYNYPLNPFGAMAQGEGASLLIRAYNLSEDKRFLLAADKALDFMLLSVEDGGTTKYVSQDMILLEFTHMPAVLNGWIFSLMGLYDVAIAINDNKYMEYFERALGSLKKYLPDFDCRYWSRYDIEKKIASPFYHHLHIAQLKALYLLSEDEIFLKYANKWENEEKNLLYKNKAIFIKAIQKLKEK